MVLDGHSSTSVLYSWYVLQSIVSVDILADTSAAELRRDSKADAALRKCDRPHDILLVQLHRREYFFLLPWLPIH